MIETGLGGFYYDLQKENPLMSVTLHCNTTEPENAGDPWESYIGKKDGEGYSKEPLLTSILTEDFSVSIANTWDDFSGGNMVSDIFNSVKPLGAYASFMGERMKDIKKKTDELREKDSDVFTSKAVGYIGQAVDKIDKSGIFDKAANYLGRSLVVQGTRFSYYGGTGVSFGNLGMKVTIFSDWNSELGMFETVHDKLKELYPYIMGKYVNKVTDNKDYAVLNEFFGWQMAPGGYKANIKNVDVVQDGTLKLKFGGYYSISNLVVRDAQFVFSKQMMKHPTSPGEILPLYCDLMLSLQPATKYSDVSLRSFVSGEKTTEERNELANKMRESLDSKKEEVGKLTKK